MKLRHKYYPYPVLIKDGEYYTDSNFSVSISQSLDGYNVKIVLEAFLDNQELQNLIDKRVVSYLYHIECPQTCLRRIVRSNEKKTELLLQDKEVNGEIQICSFIVACETIEKYTNESFAPDFRGWKFNIEKGCVMAIGEEYSIIVNKLRDDFKDTSSIFSIVKDLNPNACNMQVDMGKPKLIISLPEKTYYQYMNIQNNVGIQPVMHQMVIIPALVFVISELKNAKDQLYEYEGLRWYRSLSKACSGIGISLDPESIENINSLNVAQQLLNNPIITGIDYHATYGGSYED